MNLIADHVARTIPRSFAEESVEILINLFNETFASTYHTRLVRGQDEPVYLPASQQVPYHQIVFAHGFYASALHEIAHWCIAGAERRKLEDYGYWYCPDGRDPRQQREFENVEIKPQAIEWAFSIAAKRRFSVSSDNLGGAEPDRASFTQAVLRQLKHYLEQGFPQRAQHFLQVLHSHYGTSADCIGLAVEKKV